MDHNKTVIIIGAGIGGIATSISLAKNGYKVRVYEKTSGPGGRCGQIIREGHRFDLGATILLMPSVYREVFEYLGLNLDDLLELKSLAAIYKIYFGNGNEMAFSMDQEIIKEQLEKIEPGSFENFKLYIDEGLKFFKISMKKLLGKNFYNFFQFAKPGNIALLTQLKTYISHTSYISRFFKNSDLRRAFTFQNIYVGQNPYKSPALFSMLPAVELTEGALFPVGGMFMIVEKLVSIAKNSGVEFFFNAPVVKIETGSNSASGIILGDGTMKHADIIVVNADLPYAYSNLLPGSRISRRINKMSYACWAIVFHWGLDKTYPQLWHHSVFLSSDYKNNLDMIFNKKIFSDKPSFYIHAPVNTDPTAAPPGQDSLSLIVPVGHLDKNYAQNWDYLRENSKVFNL